MNAFFAFLKQKFAPYFSFDNVGHLFFLVFAVLSLQDAFARILITDPAFYLFNIINHSWFVISGERYTTVLNQFLVVLAVKLNIPLKQLIPLYSVSFVLLRYAYFLIAVKLFKNRSAGFAIILFSVLGIAESYFRPTSESTIALLNSALFFAFLLFTDDKYLPKKRLAVQLIGTFLFVLFGYYTHPISLFSLVFAIGYFSVRNKKLTELYPYVSLCLVGIIFFGKILIGNNTSHHESLYGNLFNSPFEILKELPSYYPYKFFSHHFKQLYRVPAILFIVATVLLLVSKKRRLCGLAFVGYSFIYFVVACTSFKKGDANMQMEKIFLPLIFFTGITLADGIQLLKSEQTRQILLSFLTALCVLVGISRIALVRPLYEGRVSYLKEIVDKANRESNSKFLISSEQVDRKMIFTWAMGVETLMLSSMDENQKTLTVYCRQGSEDVESVKELADNFIASHFDLTCDYSQFNKNYFELPKVPYVVWDVDIK